MQHFRALARLVTLVIALSLTLSSCATLSQTWPSTAYQRTKPLPGQPEREIRIFAMIFDIALLGWPLAIDFATKKIYREAPKHPIVTPVANR